MFVTPDAMPFMFVAKFVSFTVLLNRVKLVSFDTLLHTRSILFEEIVVISHITGVSGGDTHVLFDLTDEYPRLPPALYAFTQ